VFNISGHSMIYCLAKHGLSAMIPSRFMTISIRIVHFVEIEDQFGYISLCMFI
jgi:hypothetical protein